MTTFFVNVAVVEMVHCGFKVVHKTVSIYS